MHFSLKIAQDVFQTKMDQTFEGCKGVVGIVDEIVFFGKINLDTALKLNPTIAL